MIVENQHLICAPEVRQWMLVNLFNGQEILVTKRMLDDAFGHNPEELQRILSNRSKNWFLEDVYYE